MRATHCAALQYNPRASLIVCLDYNVEPGVAAICQEQQLPNGLGGAGIIGEVHIPRNSTTPAVCRKIIQDWGQHTGPVYIYGDATGCQRRMKFGPSAFSVQLVISTTTGARLPIREL